MDKSPGPLNQPFTESKMDQSSTEVDLVVGLNMSFEVFKVGGTTITNEG